MIIGCVLKNDNIIHFTKIKTVINIHDFKLMIMNIYAIKNYGGNTPVIVAYAQRVVSLYCQYLY